LSFGSGGSIGVYGLLGQTHKSFMVLTFLLENLGVVSFSIHYVVSFYFTKENEIRSSYSMRRLFIPGSASRGDPEDRPLDIPDDDGAVLYPRRYVSGEAPVHDIFSASMVISISAPRSDIIMVTGVKPSVSRFVGITEHSFSFGTG
jgi:hypothetical protein